MNNISTKSLNIDVLGNLDQLVRSGVIQYRNTWNNQHERLLSDNNDAYPFNFPAVLFEIIDPMDIKLLGRDENGQSGRVYKITARFHILYQEFDSEDGDMDKNLDVYDCVDAVGVIFDGWQASGSSTFMRSSETQDKNHGNLYHYILDYVCEFIEFNLEATPTGPYPLGLSEVVGS